MPPLKWFVRKGWGVMAGRFAPQPDSASNPLQAHRGAGGGRGGVFGARKDDWTKDP